jgi:hypothetical protein
LKTPAQLTQRPAKVAAVTLVNKIARMSWFAMVRDEVYRGKDEIV